MEAFLYPVVGNAPSVKHRQVYPWKELCFTELGVTLVERYLGNLSLCDASRVEIRGSREHKREVPGFRGLPELIWHMVWAKLAMGPLQKLPYTKHDQDRLTEDDIPARGGQSSEFERDRTSLLRSDSFRKLQAKTQLFPIGQADYACRTRMTHSLEVAQVGKNRGPSPRC